jgi:membrane fusion protein, multidrug efflux system
MKSKKQIITSLAIVAGLILILAIIKGIQIYIAISSNSNFSPPPETVTSVVVTESSWQKTLKAVGALESPHGTVLSAEASGRIQAINFESGNTTEAGTVLLELDSQVEKANLLSAQATRDEAVRNFERAKKLRATNTIPEMELDIARAKADSAVANLESSSSILKRRTVVAPYKGILGIRRVTVGEYIESGTQIVPLQSLDPLYVNFALPQKDLGQIKVGQEIQFNIDLFPNRSFQGSLTAINSQIDVDTRTIALQATLPNPNHELRPGMFGRVTISLDTKENIIALPNSSISYAPYGDAVYVIESKKNEQGVESKSARQQIVKLGEHRGDLVTILSGLKVGDEVATSGTFKLRPGVGILVNNQIQPGNTTDPKPEDQ